MAVETVDALGELTSPASNDEIGIWDVSAGQYMRIQRSNLLGATITGGGTIALGGYTLTVPATGTAALLATANVFTADQTIGNLSLSSNAINLTGGALGNGVRGPTLFLQRNTSDSTPAHINFAHAGSPSHTFLWSDDSGVMRVIWGYSTEWPTAATRNSGGTVVGAQTSSLDSKDVIGAPLAIDDVLAAVAAGASAVRRFTYKRGAYNGEEFSGVVTDFAPRYGMDRDADHPAGKSLNVITVIGDLLLAVADLSARVAALEAGA